MSEVGWALTSAQPLAFGGWQFTITGPSVKRLEWWPGDAHLMYEQRPFRAAPVRGGTSKAARAAATALVAFLNEQEEAA